MAEMSEISENFAHFRHFAAARYLPHGFRPSRRREWLILALFALLALLVLLELSDIQKEPTYLGKGGGRLAPSEMEQM